MSNTRTSRPAWASATIIFCGKASRRTVPPGPAKPPSSARTIFSWSTPTSGHNVRLGNHVILANGALLAGHVEVGDRAFISGNCLVHQFIRVGTLALMQGGASISKDLPPFAIARGANRLAGLNIIGLRRAGFTPRSAWN